jgi:hypothetical protein
MSINNLLQPNNLNVYGDSFHTGESYSAYNSVYQATPQATDNAISTSVPTVISFDTPLNKPRSGAYNATTYFPIASGNYLIEANSSFYIDPSATGSCQFLFQIIYNGSVIAQETIITYLGSTAQSYVIPAYVRFYGPLVAGAGVSVQFTGVSVPSVTAGPYYLGGNPLVTGSAINSLSTTIFVLKM